MFIIGIVGVVILFSMVGYLIRKSDVSETAKTEITTEDVVVKPTEVTTEDVVVKPLDWFNENQSKFNGLEWAMVKKGCLQMSDEEAKELVKIRLESPSVAAHLIFYGISAFIFFFPLFLGGFWLSLFVFTIPISIVWDLIASIVLHVHKRNVFKRNFIKVYPFLKGI